MEWNRKFDEVKCSVLTRKKVKHTGVYWIGLEWSGVHGVGVKRKSIDHSHTIFPSHTRYALSSFFFSFFLPGCVCLKMKFSSLKESP